MNPRYWVVIPAAGTGSRMGADMPKQYLSLLGKRVIEWSLAPFLEESLVEAIVVVLAVNDTCWPTLSIAKHRKVRVTLGGASRSDSVNAGLALLTGEARDNDWVLVHDAARPCLTNADLNKLITTLKDDDEGGLLATPLADTLKQVDSEQHVIKTLPRSDLWRALTPQMFRFDVLRRALAQAAGSHLTDDAAAIEALGLRPRLIAGRADNLKITVPEDLHLAECILAERLKSSSNRVFK